MIKIRLKFNSTEQKFDQQIKNLLNKVKVKFIDQKSD